VRQARFGIRKSSDLGLTPIGTHIQEIAIGARKKSAPEHEIAGVCPANSVPAAARVPTAVDRPTEPSLAPSNPRERLYAPR
jgi:hypothetical protein